MIEDPFCERQLHVRGGLPAVAQLGRPVQAGEDWKCPFWIEGLHEKPRWAYGVDSMQSVIMALEGIRASLDSADSDYTSDMTVDGYHGFPVIVPVMNREAARRIRELVSAELSSSSR